MTDPKTMTTEELLSESQLMTFASWGGSPEEMRDFIRELAARLESARKFVDEGKTALLVLHRELQVLRKLEANARVSLGPATGREHIANFKERKYILESLDHLRKELEK